MTSKQLSRRLLRMFSGPAAAGLGLWIWHGDPMPLAPAGIDRAALQALGTEQLARAHRL